MRSLILGSFIFGIFTDYLNLWFRSFKNVSLKLSAASFRDSVFNIIKDLFYLNYSVKQSQESGLF
jgi:hypothetical protein